MQKNNRPVIAFILVLALCFTQLSPAYAAKTIDDGVKATCDEAYYATMDYYGNLIEGSVVKSYITNGKSQITDYGIYDDVSNLTNSTKPKISGDKTIFTFGDKVPSHFYFEGKSAAPFYSLPWTTEIHYRHNGVMSKAEDLAGQPGMFDILLDFTPNENASEYAKNNYVLAATAVFNQDDILSLEAEGAQVQLVGNLRLVLFMVLPGEEQHFEIRVGADDFSFGGMTFLIVPATLAQLQEVARLSGDKDKIEDNYRLLSDSLSTLLDSFDSMGGNLREAAEGLDEINEGREIVSQQRDSLYKDADAFLVDFEKLDTSLQKMPAHLDAAEKIASQTSIALDSLTVTNKDLKKSLREVQKDMNKLQLTLTQMEKSSRNTSKDLKKLGEQADKIKEDFDGLVPLLADLQIKIGSDEITLGGSTLGAVSADIANADTAKTLYYEANGGTDRELSKKDFTKTLFIVDLVGKGKTATEAATTYTNVVNLTNTIAQVASDQGISITAARTVVYSQAGMDATAQTQYEAAADGIANLEEIYTKFSGGDKMSLEEFLKAMTFIQAKNAGASDVIAMSTVNSKAAQLKLYSNLNNLSSCIEMLGYTGLSKNSSYLIDYTADVIKEFNSISNNADDILDQADDILDSIERISDVRKENIDDIKGTVTDMKEMIDGLSGAVKSSHSLLKNLETTLKSAGKKLNSGAQKSLHGIAESLRAAARSLDKTGNVKSAKNNISSIIEDIWNDYTGDVNRLLLMDATAPSESITDARNDAPTSIQIMMRSQEIKVDKDAVEDIVIDKEKTTFWGRIAQMFKDLFAAIKGIFN